MQKIILGFLLIGTLGYGMSYDVTPSERCEHLLKSSKKYSDKADKETVYEIYQDYMKTAFTYYKQYLYCEKEKEKYIQKTYKSPKNYKFNFK